MRLLLRSRPCRLAGPYGPPPSVMLLRRLVPFELGDSFLKGARGPPKSPMQIGEPGHQLGAIGGRGSPARWPDLTQTLQPRDPAVAMSLAPAGSLSHESWVNSSPLSIKLPSTTSNSMPRGTATATLMPGAQRSRRTRSKGVSYNTANSTPGRLGTDAKDRPA